VDHLVCFLPQAVQIEIRLPSRLEPVVVKTGAMLKSEGEGDATGEDRAEGDTDDPQAEQRVKEVWTHVFSLSLFSSLLFSSLLFSSRASLTPPSPIPFLHKTLTRIQRGLSKIQLQQQRDRRRLSFQDKANTDSHNDFIMSSIVETAFFVGASLFQIFFVRRWFASRVASGTKQGV
jgi:hypothetical protein